MITVPCNVIMGLWNMNRGPSDVIMGPLIMNMGLCNVVLRRWNLNTGP